MTGIALCLNTQTPPLRFHMDVAQLAEKYGVLPDPVPVDFLTEGVDYDLAIGGVPVMLRTLVRSSLEDGWARSVRWISLNPTGPERYIYGGVACESVAPAPAAVAGYAECKERLWEHVHGLSAALPTASQFRAFASYNWASAERMLAALEDTDLFYVHDFQQILTGHSLGLAAPAVFRWHVPFQPEHMTKPIRRFLVRALEGFDAVVVSCRRDLEGLIRAGFRGTARQAYPYSDSARWPTPSPESIESFARRFRVSPSDKVILVPGRMDPIKGQDTCLLALPALLKTVPDARLFFVGNGSFSSSGRGLGLSKAGAWRQRLERLVGEARLRDEVVFTGYIADDELAAAFARSDVVVQPSRAEGFGLTTIEAWHFRKPVAVSTGAGVSELVNPGVNGLTFAPDDADGLARAVGEILADPDLSARMGARGRETAERCNPAQGIRRIREILEDTMDRGRRPS